MKQFFALVLTPILLTAFGEFMLKHTVNVNVLASRLNLASNNLYIALAIALIILGGVIWLIALSRYELSFLYPFQTINYIIIIIGSSIILGEQVSINRYISIIFISAGLIIISRSPNTSSH